MELTCTAALKSNVVSLDPSLEDDVFSQHIILQIYESLFGHNNAGDVVPLLVTDWKVVNEKEYLFTLKKGVLFHNHEELTSDDVIASFEKVLSKESMNWWALSYVSGARTFHDGKSKTVSGLHKVDKYTLRVHLAETYAPFIKVLASPYLSIMPAKLIKSKHDFASLPVGTGPYMMKHNEENTITLTQFKKYHGGDVVVAKVVVHTSVKDPVARFTEGKISYIPIYNKQEETRLSHAGVTSNVYQYDSWFVAFNLSNQRVDPSVRKALYHGIDKTILRSKQGDYVDITDRFIPSGLLGSSAEHFHNNYDIEAARDLVRNLPSEERTLEIIYPEKIDNFPDTPAILKHTCEMIGIKCKHKILPMGELIDRIGKGRYEAVVLHLTPGFRDTDSILYPYFHSGNPLSFINRRDEVIDDLLTKARRSFNNKTRADYYSQVDNYLCSNAYVIPLYFERVKLFFSPEFTGFNVHGMSVYDLQYKNMN